MPPKYDRNVKKKKKKSFATYSTQFHFGQVTGNVTFFLAL